KTMPLASVRCSKVVHEKRKTKQDNDGKQTSITQVKPSPSTKFMNPGAKNLYKYPVLWIFAPGFFVMWVTSIANWRIIICLYIGPTDQVARWVWSIKYN